MNDEINKKHYSGIVAEWYDLLIDVEENDIEYYRRFVEKSEGPVLELACGTGRLLLEYLKEGVQIDGVDTSEEMLEICKQKISAEELSCNLYLQDMAELDLPKKYKTIFISGGSFQLVSDFKRALKTLRAIYNHLEEGGQFIVDVFRPLEKGNIGQDGMWVKAREATNKDATKLIVYGSNRNDLDEQVINGLYKYEIYKNDRLAETVIGEINLRWYGKYEFRMMLEMAGFSKVEFDMANIMSTHGKAFVYRAVK